MKMEHEHLLLYSHLAITRLKHFDFAPLINFIWLLCFHLFQFLIMICNSLFPLLFHNCSILKLSILIK